MDIRNIRFDGNKENQSSVTARGIELVNCRHVRVDIYGMQAKELQ